VDGKIDRLIIIKLSLKKRTSTHKNQSFKLSRHTSQVAIGVTSTDFIDLANRPVIYRNLITRPSFFSFVLNIISSFMVVGHFVANRVLLVVPMKQL